MSDSIPIRFRFHTALSSDVVAAGATDFPGLKIIDLELGHVRQTINWENVTKSGSTVQAIRASPELLFTSFESSRRNSNSILESITAQVLAAKRAT
ncbi:hypothetical protein LXL04_027770 [Taraxacum kok-saghyz]